MYDSAVHAGRGVSPARRKKASLSEGGGRAERGRKELTPSVSHTLDSSLKEGAFGRGVEDVAPYGDVR